MIFVTVGTSSWDFSRLIKEADRIAAIKKAKFVIQIGNTNYEPQNAYYFRFDSKIKTEKFYEDSDLVICHAGVGSLLTAIKYKKQIVAVPRKKEFNEIIDNHQLEIANALEQENIIKVVWEIEKLEQVISDAEALPNEHINKDNKLIHNLRVYLKTLEPIFKSCGGK